MNNYKVNVIMSTYNGAKYIKEQIDSILIQKDVQIHLSVRDDGSKDETIEIVEDYINKYPDKISLIRGENEGYKKSFIDCLKSSSSDFDYYAFSDQDDMWQEDKCISAIKAIESKKDIPALYCCSPTICDENLENRKVNDLTGGSNSLEGYWTRSRLPGCCMVFNNKLYKMAINISSYDLVVIAHDTAITSIAYSFGSVYIDANSYMLHRILTSSLTTGGKGILHRVKTEYKIIFKDKDYYYTLAKFIDKYAQTEKLRYKEEYNDFISTVLNYKKSIKSRFKLLFNKKMKCGSFIADMEIKIRIMIGNY